MSATPSQAVILAVATHRRSTTIDNLLLSLLVATSIAGLFVWWEPRCRHWFVVPVLLCGTVIGADAVAWVRRQCSLFDPAGLLGLLGVHFFFLAPLLHVTWDVWMPYVVPPKDWRGWLGAMALLNFIGILAYRWSRTIIPFGKPHRSTNKQYRLDERVFSLVLISGLIISCVLQIYVYHLYGGLTGYINRYANSLSYYGPSNNSNFGFVGMGWLFTLSESFPILAGIGFAVLGTGKRWARNPLLLGVVMFCFFILQLYFGGLRGSRSNIVWGLFWLVALIHFYIRPLSRRVIYAGILGLVAFMYFYAFYKFIGPKGFQALDDSAVRAQMVQKTGWTLHAVLLADLDRSDVQAYALYKLVSDPGDYEYALGRTYLGGLALVIPRSVWPTRPSTKGLWTTRLEFGKGVYSAGVLMSSRVYGLAGEAMLNFGPLSVPIAFAAFGLMVGWVRRLYQKLDYRDSRRLLLPLLILFCMLLLVADSDVLVVFLVKYGSVPAFIIALGSILVRISRSSASRWDLPEAVQLRQQAPGWRDEEDSSMTSYSPPYPRWAKGRSAVRHWRVTH